LALRRELAEVEREAARVMEIPLAGSGKRTSLPWVEALPVEFGLAVDPDGARRLLREVSPAPLKVTPDPQSGWTFETETQFNESAPRPTLSGDTFHRRSCREGGSNPHELARKGF